MFTLGVFVCVLGMLLLCPRAPPLQMETDEDVDEDISKSSSADHIMLAPLEHADQSPTSSPAPCTPTLVRWLATESAAGKVSILLSFAHRARAATAQVMSVSPTIDAAEDSFDKERPPLSDDTSKARRAATHADRGLPSQHRASRPSFVATSLETLSVRVPRLSPARLPSSVATVRMSECTGVGQRANR